MEEEKFQEVIQFAITKEIGSAYFYTQASEKAKYSDTRELLLEMAKEEERHRKMLENLTTKKVARARIKAIPDLKISDFQTEMEFKPDMSYADIIQMSIKGEEQSFKLYNYLRESSKDEDFKKLFGLLANVEANHKLKLEKIYNDEILK